MILAYILGLVTPVAGFILLLIGFWVFDRNLACQCLRCGVWFGVVPSEGKPTFTRVTQIKFALHQKFGNCEKRTLKEFKPEGEQS